MEIGDRTEEAVVGVCMRVADQPRPVAGSRQRPCDSCGEAVWLSPATEEALGPPGAITAVCVQCAMQMEPPEAVVAPTEGQIRELAQRIGEDLA